MNDYGDYLVVPFATPVIDVLTAQKTGIPRMLFWTLGDFMQQLEGWPDEKVLGAYITWYRQFTTARVLMAKDFGYVDVYSVLGQHLQGACLQELEPPADIPCELHCTEVYLTFEDELPIAIVGILGHARAISWVVDDTSAALSLLRDWAKPVTDVFVIKKTDQTYILDIVGGKIIIPGVPVSKNNELMS